MGCFGSSKSNKVAPQVDPEPQKCSSAPSGTLEVEKDWPKEAAPRQLSDDGTRAVEEGAARGGLDSSQSPVTPSSAKLPKQKQAQEASPGLANLLPQAVTIPDHAQAWTQVLPEHVVRALYSADWKDREQGVNGCAKILAVAAQSSIEAEPAFNVGCEVLKHTLKDKVVPMYFCSLELLSSVLQAFVGTGALANSKPVSAVPLARLQKGVASFVPLLVHRYANLNARIQDTSLQALLSIATSPCLGTAMIAPLILPQQHGAGTSAGGEEAERGCAARVKLQARLSLAAELLHHLSTSTALPSARGGGREELRSAGLAEEAVLQLCREGLDSSEGAARMHGMRTLAELHRFKRMRGRHEGASPPGAGPPELGAGLDADSCVGTIKPALASLLAKRFAEVDAELSGGGGGASGSTAAALSIEGTGSLRASISASPMGSRGSLRSKSSQLPPLVRSGARAARLTGSTPSSPAAPLRTHTPLATHPEHMRSPSPGLQSKAPNHARSPIPESMLNDEDEALLDDLLQ